MVMHFVRVWKREEQHYGALQNDCKYISISCELE